MKRLSKVIFIALLLALKTVNAQDCAYGGIYYQYTTTNYTLLFQDQSTSPLGWNKEYTHWDFGDGSLSYGEYSSHTFPDTLIYMVKLESKFSEPGNPSNFCLYHDSVQVDISELIVYPNPHINMRLKWLYGLTYGISSYHYGQTEDLFEIVVDTGFAYTVSSGNVPMEGIFTSHQEFFTYTLPNIDNYTVTCHAHYPIINGSISITYHIHEDSIPETPADCYATFFMVPDTTEINSWILYNYSAGTNLTYFWDFGDGSTSDEENPVHLYDSAGLYTICLTIENDSCSDTYCETVFGDSSLVGFGMQKLRVINSPTGIIENNIELSEFSVYPNPAENLISLRLKTPSEAAIAVIYDQMGREKTSQTLNPYNPVPDLNISELNSGLYLIRIIDISGQVTGVSTFIKK